MAVKMVAFLFLITVLAWIQSANSSMETVWLKDLTTEFQTDKRTLGDYDLPDELTFHLRRMSGDLTLNLKRNRGINPNADIYMSRTSKDSRSVLVKARDLEISDVAYYQDVENYAFMTVRCVKRSNDQCDRVINGNIQIGNRDYDIRPAETDVTSRNVLEVPGQYGKRYILQDQVHTPRDTASVEQEIMALFQPFEGHRNQNHLSPSDVVLSSIDATAVNNRSAKGAKRNDKTRQPRALYYVKVAVLVDSLVWDLYSSMVHSINPLTRSRKVKAVIRESFSHIMNGVDLRYKRIQDNSISISVFLSKFVYFKRKTDLHMSNAKVTVVNGVQHVDVNKYLLDLATWDTAIGTKIKPDFDTAMLFTRYNLYDNVLSESAAGMSYHGRVCYHGSRLSIVQTSDYLYTSLCAAHELGHSLGAEHDGEGDSRRCRAGDYFIMTTQEPTISPSIPYPTNLWIFSSCSVNAFKKTLKERACVTLPGYLYNDDEYTGFIRKEPGEAYTLNHQCHVINEPGSVYCGINPLNMCYLKCSNPKTSTCPEIYYSAASGTQCGHNMWCIQARCVRKGHK